MKIKEKINNTKTKVKNDISKGAKKVWKFTEDNADHILFLAFVVFLGGEGCKNIKKTFGTTKTAYERDRELRSKSYYDRHSGRTYKLKREPKAWELMEIESRSRKGEPVIYILEDLGLLKRW